jgi:hypothetical protein
MSATTKMMILGGEGDAVVMRRSRASCIAFLAPFLCIMVARLLSTLRGTLRNQIYRDVKLMCIKLY